jgi:hypothetical protein
MPRIATISAIAMLLLASVSPAGAEDDTKQRMDAARAAAAEFGATLIGELQKAIAAGGALRRSTCALSTSFIATSPQESGDDSTPRRRVKPAALQAWRTPSSSALTNDGLSDGSTAPPRPMPIGRDRCGRSWS